MHYMIPRPSERRTQLLKGVLDMCVLAVLRSGPTYGYGLVTELERRGVGLVAEGSVYPLLTRLSNRGLVRSYREPSLTGPTRRYYELTTAGETALSEATGEWQGIVAEVNELLEQSSVDFR